MARVHDVAAGPGGQVTDARGLDVNAISHVVGILPIRKRLIIASIHCGITDGSCSACGAMGQNAVLFVSVNANRGHTGGERLVANPLRLESDIAILECLDQTREH